jgi:hypothetical protein
MTSSTSASGYPKADKDSADSVKIMKTAVARKTTVITNQK